MRDNTESIKAKLRNISKKGQTSHQLTLTRYFQERLLFRLSKSAFRDHFFLKGGVLIYALEGEASRPTLDLDFLARKIEADGGKLRAIFREICEIQYDIDAVSFDTESLEIDEIIKEGNYAGIRIKVTAFLGNIRHRMQIDIGFGDVVIPGPIRLQFPTLLEMDAPDLLAYSVESLVAEKFEAMISLAEFNSRMKDFFDIYRVLLANSYDEKVLQKAIAGTITRRNTSLSTNHAIFSVDFVADEKRNSQWQAFLKRANLQEDLVFADVMDLIKKKLKPIYTGLQG